MRDLLTAGSPLLQDFLSLTVHRQLIELAARKSYADGQLIYSRGDNRVGNIGNDGSYLATSVLDNGQCFGEFTVFAGLPRTHDITAAGETNIAECPKG
ncbi:MAG: CRP/FNR family cyclic AMP-dependent transcriptional regulator [Candidatus Azotimanducaceae bacterium]|jgi:CRP/FNR family cyclic AMP-dependent transcriptional regulator